MPIDQLRERIEREDDVKQVLRLEPHGARFRYLIETPFETFPKFVIGTTDAENSDVRIEHRCGLLSTAMEQWNAGIRVHTPGPWTFENGQIRTRFDNNGVSLGVAACLASNVEYEANGRLIAEAPRLLSAVKAFITHGALAGIAPEKDASDPVAALLFEAQAAYRAATGKEEP
jgi:hypothetical protein